MNDSMPNISIYYIQVGNLHRRSNFIGSLSRNNERYPPLNLGIMRNKMTGVNSRFASVSDADILEIQQNAIPFNTKKSTKFGLPVFQGKLVA